MPLRGCPGHWWWLERHVMRGNFAAVISGPGSSHMLFNFVYRSWKFALIMDRFTIGVVQNVRICRISIIVVLRSSVRKSSKTANPDSIQRTLCSFSDPMLE
jgi:hypothetical protein